MTLPAIIVRKQEHEFASSFALDINVARANKPKDRETVETKRRHANASRG